tara:strand:+ start:267 stop:542 length:276 start_codon:yes stop_codon:yes gene_type:complete
LGSGPEEEEEVRGTKYSNYMDEEKGGYILAECAWALIEGGLFLYFFFVTYKFDQSYYPEEKEEEKKADEEKKPEDDKPKEEEPAADDKAKE